jgi:hypothetical protein
MARALEAEPHFAVAAGPPASEEVPEIKRMGGRGALGGGLVLAMKVLPAYLPWVLRGSSLASPAMEELETPVSLRGLLALSMWSRYVGVSFGQFRRGGGYGVTHFFKEHIHLVDDQLDAEPPLPASAIKSDPLNRLSVHHIADAIMADLPERSVRKEVADIIQRSRRQAIEAVEREQAAGPLAPAQDVVQTRQETTYNTMKAIVEIWDAIHGVPPAKAARVEESLASMAMVIQAKDDLVDVGEDYGKRQNLVSGFLQGHPAEKSAFEARLKDGGKPTIEWLSANAPATMRDVYGLYRGYLSRINPGHEPLLRSAQEIAEYVFLHLENIGDKDRIRPWTRIASRQ